MTEKRPTRPRRRLSQAELEDPVLRALVYEITEASARLKAAREEADQQRARLHDALLRAHRAGLGYRRLAEASGYTWQRAAQIVSHDPERPVRTRPLLTSGFPPAGTSGQELADLVAGAVGELPDCAAAITVLAGPGLAEVREAYPGLAWDEPSPDSESLVAALFVAFRGREDADDLMTEVHQAVAAAWTARWGRPGPASLPLDLATWRRLAAGSSDFATTDSKDPGLMDAVQDVGWGRPKQDWPGRRE